MDEVGKQRAALIHLGQAPPPLPGSLLHLCQAPPPLPGSLLHLGQAPSSTSARLPPPAVFSFPGRVPRRGGSDLNQKKPFLLSSKMMMVTRVWGLERGGRDEVVCVCVYMHVCMLVCVCVCVCVCMYYYYLEVWNFILFLWKIFFWLLLSSLHWKGHSDPFCAHPHSACEILVLGF